jgi:hypothetical protein
LGHRLERLARDKPGNPYLRGRLSTIDLLIKIGCFVKQKKYDLISKSS